MNEQILYNRPLPGARLNMAHPLTKGLVGCWLLNENGGMRAFDSSPYGHHGTLVNFAGIPNRPFNGLVFDGTNDYISVPSSATVFDFTTGSFSVFVWVKMRTLAQSSFILMRGSDNTDGWLLQMVDSGRVAVRTIQAAASQVSFSSEGEILVNNWYFIGGIRKGASIRTYVNGRDSTTIVASHTNPVTANRQLLLGINDDKVSLPFQGGMAQVLIYNRDLAPNEAWRLYVDPYGMFLKE